MLDEFDVKTVAEARVLRGFCRSPVGQDACRHSPVSNGPAAPTAGRLVEGRGGVSDGPLVRGSAR
jgi:hypothetical protein